MKVEIDWTCPNCGELRLISQPLYKNRGVQCRKCKSYYHVEIVLQAMTIPYMGGAAVVE